MNREGRLPLEYKLLRAMYNRAAVSKDVSFVDLCALLAMSEVAMEEGKVSPSQYQTLLTMYGNVRTSSGLHKVDPQPTALFARCLGTLFHYVYSTATEGARLWQYLAHDIDSTREYFGPGEYETLADSNTHLTQPTLLRV